MKFFRSFPILMTICLCTVTLYVFTLLLVAAPEIKAAQVVDLTIGSNDIYLTAETNRYHFHNNGGWYVQAVEVNHSGTWVETYKPVGSNGFFEGDVKATGYVNESAGTKKQVKFTFGTWTATFWADSSETMPWLHVKTTGATGKTIKYRTVAQGAEDGAAWGFYSSYRKNGENNGTWRRHERTRPPIVGHSLINSRDDGYILIPENTTHLPGPGNYDWGHDEVQWNNGRTDAGGSNYYGYWGLQYDAGYNLQYRMLYTTGKNILDLLKSYLDPMIKEIVDMDALLVEDIWDEKYAKSVEKFMDPQNFAEGHAMMAIEANNETSTYGRSELMLSMLNMASLAYAGILTEEEELVNFSYEKIKEFNARNWLNEPGASTNESIPSDYPWTWTYPDGHNRPGDGFNPLWSDFEMGINHMAKASLLIRDNNYLSIPHRQMVKFWESKMDPTLYTIKSKWNWGTNTWNLSNRNDGVAAFIAWNLLTLYKRDGIAADRDQAYAILDHVLNPKINGQVEDVKHNVAGQSGGLKAGPVMYAALANILRYEITNDSTYLDYAENFTYLAMTMFSFKDDNSDAATWFIGTANGAEGEQDHAPPAGMIESVIPAQLIGGLLKYRDIPAAYTWLNIFAKNHDNFYGSGAGSPFSGHTYHSAPTMIEYLMFKKINTISDNQVLLVCPDVGLWSTEIKQLRTLKAYNPTGTNKTVTIKANYMNDGIYNVKIDGVSLGNFTETQLEAGVITLTLTPAQYKTIEITPNTATASGTGSGLRGEYYNSGGDQYMLGRVDQTVNFTWGTSSPATGVNNDNFAVIWSGEVEAPVTGEYTFYTNTDDGVNLWIDRQLIINQPQLSASATGKIQLNKGIKYPIRMEYFEGTGSATAKLEWSAPSVTKQVVPQIHLYPDAIESFTGHNQVTYLSDIVEDGHSQYRWLSTTAEVHPEPALNRLKKDKSVAGNTLTLNGTTYTKGLGTHAESVISYTLDYNYDYFQAKIGVDDEVTNTTSGVIFQVWGDGRILYDSGTMFANTATKTVNVEVRGIKNLKLFVLDNGDHKLYDHADWADAKLVGEEGPSSYKLEAENANLSGGPNVTNIMTGYSGTGYVKSYYNVNAATEFTLNQNSAGSAKINIGYYTSNTNVTLAAYVNGVKVRDIYLPRTSHTSTTWGNRTESFTFNAGVNTLMLKNEVGSGSDMNLDYLIVEDYGSSTPPTVIAKYDFNKSTSPTAAGYTGVTNATLYNSTLGYGWNTITNLKADDRAIGSDLERDLIQSNTDFTFMRDLPNGVYTVKVYMGDKGTWTHDNMTVSAEGNVVVNNVTVPAGTVNDYSFNVTVADGQLNLLFHDGGGSDVNWVANGVEIYQATPTSVAKFDFNKSTSPTAAGYTGVTNTTLYNSTLGYGWNTITNLKADDRAIGSDLERDLIQSNTDFTFMMDLPNGVYTVKVYMGDKGTWTHDNMTVSAEGNVVVNNVTVPAGTVNAYSFNVTIADGQLNLLFHDGGGSDVNWVANGVEISTP